MPCLLLLVRVRRAGLHVRTPLPRLRKTIAARHNGRQHSSQQLVPLSEAGVQRQLGLASSATDVSR